MENDNTFYCHYCNRVLVGEPLKDGSFAYWHDAVNHEGFTDEDNEITYYDNRIM